MKIISLCHYSSLLLASKADLRISFGVPPRPFRADLRLFDSPTNVYNPNSHYPNSLFNIRIVYNPNRIIRIRIIRMYIIRIRYIRIRKRSRSKLCAPTRPPRRRGGQDRAPAGGQHIYYITTTTTTTTTASTTTTTAYIILLLLLLHTTTTTTTTTTTALLLLLLL